MKSVHRPTERCWTQNFHSAYHHVCHHWNIIYHQVYHILSWVFVEFMLISGLSGRSRMMNDVQRMRVMNTHRRCIYFNWQSMYSSDLHSLARAYSFQLQQILHSLGEGYCSFLVCLSVPALNLPFESYGVNKPICKYVRAHRQPFSRSFGTNELREGQLGGRMLLQRSLFLTP